MALQQAETPKLSTKLRDVCKEHWKEIDVQNLSSTAAAWIRDHPGQAAILTASIVTSAAPGIVALPALNVVGFGAGSVVGGSSILAI